MGSNNSTEVEPLHIRPDFIPPIPNWDGNSTSIMPVPVEIEYNVGFNMKSSVTTSINKVLDAITAENTAGSGYKLVSIFLPYWPPWLYDEPEPLEWSYGDGFFNTTKYVKAMCIFQKDQSSSQEKFSLRLSTVQMKIISDSSSENIINLQGHENIYNQLVEAGMYLRISKIIITTKYNVIYIY